MPLLAGSQAIKLGVPAGCTANGGRDQRGVTRPATGCDSGAFEVTPTSLTPSANPSQLRNAIHFVAKVSSAAGTPAGSVQFTIDGSNFGPAVTLAGGSATSSMISTLAVGSHAITAVYSGTATLSGFTGILTQWVTYQIKALYVQTGRNTSGATVPITVQLLDATGKNLSSSKIVLTLSSPALSPNPTPGAQPIGKFTFVSTSPIGPFYHLNVKTTGYPAHTYTLSFTVSGDPVAHTVNFVIG
jgi:hypothetical protein